MATQPRSESQLLTHIVQRMADDWRIRTPGRRLVVVAGIVIALAIVWAFVHATGGTRHPGPHFVYVPVILASLALGIRGGVLTALAGGILMGPLMPLDVELGVAQPIENMVYRTGFYLLAATVNGAFADVLRKRHEQVLLGRAELAAMNSRTLRLFARLVTERDEQTGGHSERVAHNAVAVAQALGQPESQLKRIYWAGILHDLGKLAVPEAILRKPGRLTSAEFAEITRHPAFGEQMLLDISESFRDIAHGLRSHHERWDGRGYPDGLSGEAIPLFGRILAVVDVFEALTSSRPYRLPMTRDEARSAIREGIGTHFDPEIGSLFLALERDGVIVRERDPEPLFDDLTTTGVFSSSAALRALN